MRTPKRKRVFCFINWTWNRRKLSRQIGTHSRTVFSASYMKSISSMCSTLWISPIWHKSRLISNTYKIISEFPRNSNSQILPSAEAIQIYMISLPYTCKRSLELPMRSIPSSLKKSHSHKISIQSSQKIQKNNQVFNHWQIFSVSVELNPQKTREIYRFTILKIPQKLLSPFISLFWPQTDRKIINLMKINTLIEFFFMGSNPRKFSYSLASVNSRIETSWKWVSFPKSSENNRSLSIQLLAFT